MRPRVRQHRRHEPDSGPDFPQHADQVAGDQLAEVPAGREHVMRCVTEQGRRSLEFSLVKSPNARIHQLAKDCAATPGESGRGRLDHLVAVHLHWRQHPLADLLPEGLLERRIVLVAELMGDEPADCRPADACLVGESRGGFEAGRGRPGQQYPCHLPLRHRQRAEALPDPLRYAMRKPAAVLRAVRRGACRLRTRQRA